MGFYHQNSIAFLVCCELASPARYSNLPEIFFFELNKQKLGSRPNVISCSNARCSVSGVGPIYQACKWAMRLSMFITKENLNYPVQEPA